MSKPDFSSTTRPERFLRDGVAGRADESVPEKFRARMPPAARRRAYIRRTMLMPHCEPPVNPDRYDVEDWGAVTQEIKELALSMGLSCVGVAAYDERLLFTDTQTRKDKTVIVMGLAMEYETMSDIGAKSQNEVHRVYHKMDESAVCIAQHIAAYGYTAKAQTNAGDFPLPALAEMAGLGELGKHGSLISPEYGSSMRLVAVSTEMPLIVDGPKDFGIDKTCESCNVCQRFCPGDAIKPDKKVVNGVMRWHVDTPACDPWFVKMYGCKICLAVCPLNSKGACGEIFKEKVASDIRVAKDARGLLELISERTGEDFTKLEENDNP